MEEVWPTKWGSRPLDGVNRYESGTNITLIRFLPEHICYNLIRDTLGNGPPSLLRR